MAPPEYSKFPVWYNKIKHNDTYVLIVVCCKILLCFLVVVVVRNGLRQVSAAKYDVRTYNFCCHANISLTFSPVKPCSCWRFCLR